MNTPAKQARAKIFSNSSLQTPIWPGDCTLQIRTRLSSGPDTAHFACTDLLTRLATCMLRPPAMKQATILEFTDGHFG